MILTTFSARGTAAAVHVEGKMDLRGNSIFSGLRYYHSLPRKIRRDIHSNNITLRFTPPILLSSSRKRYVKIRVAETQLRSQSY